jgi:hypothetical protein
LLVCNSDGDNKTTTITTDVMMVICPSELHVTGCARACTMGRRVGENGGWMQNLNYLVLENFLL